MEDGQSALRTGVRYEDDRFLKVTPNLFTQERLHLFDSMQLYTSLMKSGKLVEQGERLHNLSWRIVNKALLKDGNVNRSKKRDGVKNLYYVVAPCKVNNGPMATQTHSVKQDARPPVNNPSPSKVPYKPSDVTVSLFHRRGQYFYSSDDDGSDWEGLSESGSSDGERGSYDDDNEEEGEHDEEDSYCKNQWDELLKKQQLPPTSRREPLKRSLLSGMFLNEQSRSKSSPVISTLAPISHVAATATSTTNVTAIGSVTSPQERLGCTAPVGSSNPISGVSRGSFSSIVSEFINEKYLHESNAPPSAQTILPRALSTHMFLPNDVHQRRLDAASVNDKGLSESHPLSLPFYGLETRASMDIPGKKNGLLKTRMEISKEKRLTKVSKQNI